MELYSNNEYYKLYKGNMLDLGEVIKPCSIDAVLTDPPYELNFMGKGWDNSGIAFNSDTWKKCLEVLKPGGYLLAFGGSRTYHRIACAIEDAGFEIRDCIMWLYGSGFPKSMNIGLAIDKKNGVEVKSSYIPNDKNNVYGNKFGGGKTDNTLKANNKWNGWGTALKPSYEPIIVARKPLEGSCTDNVIKYGVGGINIDECRVGTDGERRMCGTTEKSGESSYILGAREETYTSTGRFPANTILTYGDDDKEEVCSGFPNSKGASSQNNYSNGHIYRGQSLQESKTSLNGYRERYNDEGSAARYFYCAKASKRDRDEGLDGFEEAKTTDGCIRSNAETARKFGANSALRKNIHPTVKPTDLMQYLVRLVTPNGGTVLDPFNGSGSTGKAVMYENKDRNKNYKYIGIELTEEYLPIAKARIEYAINAVEEKQEQKQPTLFDI